MPVTKGKSVTSYKKDNKKVLFDKMDEQDKIDLGFNLQEIEAKYRNKFANKGRVQSSSDKK
jgi:hypothetical protein